MLDKHQISGGCLATYLGYILGLGMVALAQFSSADVGRLGIATLALVCTYSIHRSMAAHCDMAKAAFNAGREYEQLHGLTSIH